jgi:hypothetical protein
MSYYFVRVNGENIWYNSHEAERYNEDGIIEPAKLIADYQQRELDLKEAK